MESRPPPPVTIEGGRGWQLDGGPRDERSPDTLGDDRPVRTGRLPRPSGRALALVAVGALLGYGGAEVRTDRLGEGEGGVLALEAAQGADSGSYDVAELEDGRLGNVLSVELGNAGPRPVALREVVLGSTGWAAQDVEGRRIEPGGTTQVALVRPIDCDDLGEQRPQPVPPLTVTALTDAGERQQRLRAAVDPFRLSGDTARAACGQLAPAEALVTTDEQVRYEPRVARVSLGLRNGSAEVLTVREVRPLRGLQVRLLDEQGQEVALPLRVPAGDFTEPRAPFDDSLPTLRLTAEVTIPDCTMLLRDNDFTGGPLVEVDVEGGQRSGTTFFGDGSGVLSRLRVTAC